jgi:hypothetical protein
MKEMLKNFFKYLFILALLFVLIFVSSLIFHMAPLIKTSEHTANKFINLIGPLTVPCFYFSLYNSLVISIFLFGILIFNYQKKYKVIAFLLPIIISSLIIFSILLFLKPSYKQLNVNDIDDARIYFTSKVFFENNKNKYYFNEVNSKSVNNAIIIDDKNINFYPNLNITFLEDEIILIIPNKESSEKISFPRQQLFNYKIQHSRLTTNFFKSFDNIAPRMLEQKTILLNLFLWFSFAFLIMSFTNFFKIISYPFLSLIINLFSLLLFYLFFNLFFDMYHKIFMDLIKSNAVRDLFLSIVIFISGLIFQGMHLIFSKSTAKE